MSKVFSRLGQKKCLVLLTVLILLLTACESGEDIAPRLAAPPTRTPEPATASPEPDALPPTIQVVSLRDNVDQFLKDSETASPLDRIDVFIKDVITPSQDCPTSTLWPDLQPLEVTNMMNLSLPTVDMAAWRVSVDSFPEEQLIALATETLRDAVKLMPTDAPFRVCLIPLPGTPFPEDVVNSGVDSIVLGSGVALLTCSAGEMCLDQIGPMLAHSYHAAYQYGTAGKSGMEIPLLDFAVNNGRATDFARRLFPGAVFPWSGALTTEQEVDVWTRMQEYLATTYSDYPGYRNVDLFLYGGAPGQTRYPRWGGMYIGGRIVEAYRASHPDVSLVALASLPPTTLLEESGYAPG